MAEMTLQRRQEIALAYVRFRVRKEGVSSFDANTLRRAIGETAHGVGIPLYEALEFTRLLIQEAVDGVFEAKIDSDTEIRR